MAEPIKLNKDGEEMVVHAPRWAAQLVSEEGWSLGEPSRAPRMVRQAAETPSASTRRSSNTSKSKAS